MKWDEIENKLAEHIHSQEISNLNPDMESKNKVWASISLPEKEQKSSLWIWWAAASVACFMLMGSGIFMRNYLRIRNENLQLQGSLKQLKESNKTLIQQIEKASQKSVSEIPNGIINKTDNSKSHKSERSTDILTASSIAFTGIGRPDKNDSTTMVIDESSGLVSTANSLLVTDKIANQDSSKITQDQISKEVNSPDELISLSFPERKITKKSRFRISLGSYKSEPTFASWRVTLYSR